MAPRADLRGSWRDARELPRLPGTDGGARLSPLVWTDVYGAVHALWDGWPGGHRWLVVCDGDQADAVIPQLPERFKGEVQLLLCGTVTPLEVAVRDWQPRGVLVVDRRLAAGPAVERPMREVEAHGLSYFEGGAYPAWSSALEVAAPEGECLLASAVAALDTAVVVCAPAEVAPALLAWWRATPHALLPELTDAPVQSAQR